jgi:hypothetical protein
MPQPYEAAVPPYFWAADGPTLASFTGPTLASPAPDCVIPANQLVVGSRLRVTAFGRISSTATPTYNFGVYWGGVGGVALVTSGAIATASGITNLSWRVEVFIDVRTIGTSGTFMCTGLYTLGTAALTSLSYPMPGSAPAVATVDTTAAKALVLGVTCSASSASNTLICHNWHVESIA